jgi:raffinose/stachyose/melibiose transport system substrate-binding protein
MQKRKSRIGGTMKGIACAAILAVGLASSIAAQSAKNVTLTIEGSQEFKVPSNPFFNQANIDAFQAKYPNIKVDVLVIPDAQTTQTLQTKLATGEPSDLIIYNKVSAENELTAMKNMVDLSGEAWVSHLKQPEILKSPDGKIYGFLLSISTGGMGVVYNKDIFAKYKLEAPKTYAEFLKVCDTLKANKITPLYGPFKDVWTFQIWPTSIWGTVAAKQKAGIFDDINAGKVKWSAVPQFQDTLARANDLFKKGYFQKSCLSDDYNGAPAAFSSGKYAMMLMGDWFVRDLATKDPSINLDIFPIPAFDDPALNVISQGQVGGCLFIPKKAKNIAEAKLFLDFISQPEQIARDLANPAMAYLPNFKDTAVPKLQPVNDFIYNAYVKTGKITTEANAFVKVDMNDLWKYYQDMIGGVKTPKDVLVAWDKKFAELMKAKAMPGF